jgi:predicted kinase
MVCGLRRLLKISYNYVNSMTTLHLLCGLPGAGKTTLAKKLEQAPATVRLTPDDWLGRILTAPVDKSVLDRLREPVEALQWELAEKLLRMEINVILDWGFWTREKRVWYRREASLLGVRVITHFLDAAPEELVRRLAIRNENLSVGTFHVSEAELRGWLPHYETPADDEINCLS